MKRFKARNFVLIVAGIAVAGGALLFFLGSRGKGSGPLPVRVATLERGPLTDRISASGSFVALVAETVSAAVSGKVESVAVRAGDAVAPEDEILRLDEAEARRRVEAEKIGLELAWRSCLSELTQARTAYRRASLAREQAARASADATELAAAGGLSASEAARTKVALEEAELALSAAGETLRALQGWGPAGPVLDASRDEDFARASPAYRKAAMSLEDAERSLGRSVLRAGISGRVTKIDARRGDSVAAGAALARIEDPGSITAEVAVDEADIGKVSLGLKAEIVSDSMAGASLEGWVSAISPTVITQGGGRTCSVRVSLPRSGARAVSGASCVARIESTVKAEALSLPASALIPKSKPPAVYVLEEGKDKSGKATSTARRREIKTGVSTAGRVEVLEGLAVEDRVVSEIDPGLAEGKALLPQEEADDTAGRNP